MYLPFPFKLTLEEQEKVEQRKEKLIEMERIEMEDAIREAAERHNIIFSRIATRMHHQTVVVVWPLVQELTSNLNPIWEKNKMSINHIGQKNI